MNVSYQELQELLEESTPVLVDCWADWCTPCKRFGSIFEAVADKYAGKIEFVKVDVDKEMDFVAKHNILNIPTLLYFKDGDVSWRHAGPLYEDDLIAECDKLLGE